MSVLDHVIEDIVENADYLTSENVEALANLLRDRTGTAPGPKTVPEPAGADQVLAQMRKMVTRLYDVAVTSRDADDMKLAITTSKTLLDMLMKYEAQIDHRARASAVESAIVDAIRETADRLDLPDLHDTYLRYLEGYLSGEPSAPTSSEQPAPEEDGRPPVGGPP